MSLGWVITLRCNTQRLCWVWVHTRTSGNDSSCGVGHYSGSISHTMTIVPISS